MVLINYSHFSKPENKMHKKLLLIVELPFISSRVLYWRKICRIGVFSYDCGACLNIRHNIILYDSLLSLQHIYLKMSTSEKPNRFPEHIIIAALFLKCQDSGT